MAEVPTHLDLCCPACGWVTVCGPSGMVQRLQAAKLLKPQAKLDGALLVELFQASVSRLSCPECRQMGLTTQAAAEDQDDDWGMAKVCELCKGPIPPERLEVFPETRLCVSCQSGAERGQTAEQEYCERCGSVLMLRPTRTGVTRYGLYCPSCRR